MKHPDGYYYYRLETRIVCSKDQMPKHAGKEILPTDPEFSDRWATEPMRQLREQRNQLLAETDWRMVCCNSICLFYWLCQSWNYCWI